jgi:DNA polymerase-3 subunit epsilon
VSGAWSRKLSEREAALLPFPVVPVDEVQERLSA